MEQVFGQDHMPWCSHFPLPTDQEEQKVIMKSFYWHCPFVRFNGCTGCWKVVADNRTVRGIRFILARRRHHKQLQLLHAQLGPAVAAMIVRRQNTLLYEDADAWETVTKTDSHNFSKTVQQREPMTTAVVTETLEPTADTKYDGYIYPDVTDKRHLVESTLICDSCLDGISEHYKQAENEIGCTHNTLNSEVQPNLVLSPREIEQHDQYTTYIPSPVVTEESSSTLWSDDIDDFEFV
jgi:hypothetical protein